MTTVASPPGSAMLPDRLTPARFSGRYYVLTQLRREIETVTRDYLHTHEHDVLIDVGCGDMPYRPLLQSAVARYIGVDLPANPAAQLHLTESGGVPMDDGAAGVVLSSQVLEHVPDPVAYLTECHRLLRPGGRLVLTTHGIWKYHPHPTDRWRWTGEGLRAIVQDRGFEIERCHGLLGMAATGMLLLQDAIVPRLPHFVRSTAAGLFQQAVGAMDQLHSQAERNRDASIFCIVARRVGRSETSS